MDTVIGKEERLHMITRISLYRKISVESAAYFRKYA